MNNVHGDLHYPETARLQLHQLDSKRISLDGFLKNCAYWALQDGFEELCIKPYPEKPKTQRFREFEMLSPERQRKIVPKDFQDHPEILEWLNQKKRVDQVNRGRLEWLREIKEYIPADDFAAHEKLDAKIAEFEAWERQDQEELQRLKNVFSTEEVPA